MTKSKILDEEEFDELKYGYSTVGTVLEDEITGSGRWVEYHYIVWSEDHDGTILYFGYNYDVPATEQQEGSESDFDASEIHEVFPQPVTVIKYFTQKQLNKMAEEN